MNKYQEALERIIESFGCDPAYYGLNVEFEFLQELVDKETSKKLTKAEVLKKFEMSGYYILEAPDELRKLTIINDDEGIIIRIWEDKTYDFAGYIGMQEHQLLHELFKCWGWI